LATAHITGNVSVTVEVLRLLGLAFGTMALRPECTDHSVLPRSSLNEESQGRRVAVG
jgi:hypothetical protein